jgi:hypothetical protein
MEEFIVNREVLVKQNRRQQTEQRVATLIYSWTEQSICVA